MNVFRDTGSDRELNIDDLAYWSYQALEKIGSPLIYLPKVYGYKENPEWDFSEYRVQLPNNFHKLRALSVDGRTAITSTNSYHDLLDGSCCGWNSLTNSDSIETYNDNFGNSFSPSAPPIISNVNTSNAQPTFTINNSNITFNIESGKACMAYWAFPVDDEGYPMIPDVEVIKSAVTNFIIERLDWRLFRKNLISGEIYKLSQRERNWYMAAAESAMKIPDEHQMEVMKNIALKMVIRKDDYMSAFKNSSNQGIRGRY